MALPSRAYKYSVEVVVHTVDAPGTLISRAGDLYLNICLLGKHHRTRMMYPSFPLCFNQSIVFEKMFKSCVDQRDILLRLEREHVLIELLQAHIPSPIILATYETSAKEFLYPYSTSLLQYVGLPRGLLLTRTVDFPGITPSLQITVSPSLVDVTGLVHASKTRVPRKPVDSFGRRTNTSKSWTRKKSSSRLSRSTIIPASSFSSPVNYHTISSAVKGDFGKPETQRKLRELAVTGQVKYVVNIDKTAGREPFVVRHVNNSLIGRTPLSHLTMSDGLVVNDYSFLQYGSTVFDQTPKRRKRRPRSVSPKNRGRSSSAARRARSAGSLHKSIERPYSVNGTRRDRSTSPNDAVYSHFARQPYNHLEYYSTDDEIHSTKQCDICRLHQQHRSQSERTRALEQRSFATASENKSYLSDLYGNLRPRYVPSPTLVRSPFRDRYQRSPARDLSSKVIRTVHRNIDSYSAVSSPHQYSALHYSNIY